MITLENLTKTFTQKNGTAINAVDNVSLNVPEGEMCVLLGPSGCGKSTTLKMINRLIPASSGRILINGEDTSTQDTVTLRRNIGYVIQHDRPVSQHDHRREHHRGAAHAGLG